MTQEQAMTARLGDILHYGECKTIVGKRGGQTRRIEAWRVSGLYRTWETRPIKFLLPIQHGLYTHHHVTERSMALFHLESECQPTVVQKVPRPHAKAFETIER